MSHTPSQRRGVLADAVGGELRHHPAFQHLLDVWAIVWKVVLGIYGHFKGAVEHGVECVVWLCLLFYLHTQFSPLLFLPHIYAGAWENMRAQEKGRRKKAAPLGSQNGKEKGGKAFPALAGMLFPVLRLRHLADAVQLAQQHAHHTPLRRSTMTIFIALASRFPRRSNENPKATKSTAQRNKVSPTGQKQERDIPRPKLIAHKHLVWVFLKQDQSQRDIRPSALSLCRFSRSLTSISKGAKSVTPCRPPPRPCPRGPG